MELNNTEYQFSPHDPMVEVKIVNWAVRFARSPESPVPFGVIFEEKKLDLRFENQFRFFSKKFGRELLVILRITLKQLGGPFSEGEYDLLFDEIRFSDLPETCEVPEKLEYILKSSGRSMSPILHRALLKWV